MNSLTALYLLGMLMTTSIAAAQASGTGDTPQHHHDTLEASDVPGESLYQLEISLETADGTQLDLSSLRGQPLIITMFYSHCTSVCPMLTAELQNIDRQLTPRQQAGIRVLMVSFDAVRDTPVELKSFEQLHHIDDPRWIVARARASDVRALAAALGIRYRELPDHSFNHSAVISLTDRDGVVQARSVGVGPIDPQFLRTLRTGGAEKAGGRPDGG